MTIRSRLGAALLTSLLATGAHAAESDALGREALGLFVDYLRVDTTNPPGNEIRAAEFFQKLLAKEGIASEIHESAPGRASILARLKGDGSKPAVILLNHMDVVPADMRYWTVDPFGGVQKDGYVWGRGAIDMKGLAITQVMSMIALKRAGTPLAADIVFLGTADEEAGGFMGAGYMVANHFDLVKDAGVVLSEFGAISTDEAGKVRYYGASATEKAPLWLKMTATGVPGHGSTPRPDTSVTRLIEALHRLSKHQTALKVEPVVQKFFADTAQFAPTPALRSIMEDVTRALEDPVFAADFTGDRWRNASVRNTISITMLEGSNKVNVIPPQVTAQLDVRLLPSEDPERFIAELKSVIADDSITIERTMSFAPSASPMDSEFHRVLTAVAARHDPGAIITSQMLSGFTDCHFFREKNIPCYGFMPFRLSGKELGGVHGNDERLSEENMIRGTQMMLEIVKGMAAK